MAEKYFKIAIAVFFGFAITTMCVGILSDGDDSYNVNVTQMVSAADGLNLKAVGGLLKEAKSAEDFEKLLNDKARGVNNLDLDEDGKVDYINVTEFGEGDHRGFSLTTEVEKGEVQEIATINIEKAPDGSARVQTEGNSAIYGNNHYYHSSWSPGFGTGLLMGYLFAPHSYYRSPYGYGAYPPSYSGYSTVPPSNYQNQAGKYTSASDAKPGRHGKMTSLSKSPNAGKSASKIKAPLKNPTASQKSFQKTSASKSRSGGFGRSSSVRSSGRSGGSFGGK